MSAVTYSLILAPCGFQLLPKVTMTMKGSGFESIQDLEAARAAQQKTLRQEDSEAAQDSGMSVMNF